jgi:hypothetical protein
MIPTRYHGEKIIKKETKHLKRKMAAHFMDEKIHLITGPPDTLQILCQCFKVKGIVLG